jgi:hypothetical protein
MNDDDISVFHDTPTNAASLDLIWLRNFSLHGYHTLRLMKVDRYFDRSFGFCLLSRRVNAVRYTLIACVKASPTSGREGVQDCEMSRIAYFLDSRFTDGVKISPRSGPHRTLRR